MAKRILGSVISFFLCAIIAFVSCYFAIPDFNAWVNNIVNRGQNEQENVIPDIPNDNNGGAIVSGSENSGIKLYSAEIPFSAYEVNGVSPLADTAFVLTASIAPLDADNKQVDYSIAWKNPSSDWANGKNIQDYLALAQSADGALTATLACAQAFGEQAIITVVARGAENVKATATVDYRKKLINATGGIFNGDISTTKTWDKSSSIRIPSNYNWSVGTVEDTVKSSRMSISVSSDLKSSLTSNFTSSSDRNTFMKTVDYDKSISWTLSTDGMLNSGGPYNSTGLGGPAGILSFCTDLYDYGEQEIISSKYNKLRTCLLSCAVDFVIVVSIETTNGGTINATYKVNVLDSSLAILPSGITLDNSSIVF